MALEAISEHVIFLGRMCSQTPLAAFQNNCLQGSFSFHEFQSLQIAIKYVYLTADHPAKLYTIGGTRKATSADWDNEYLTSAERRPNSGEE